MNTIRFAVLISTFVTVTLTSSFAQLKDTEIAVTRARSEGRIMVENGATSIFRGPLGPTTHTRTNSNISYGTTFTAAQTKNDDTLYAYSESQQRLTTILLHGFSSPKHFLWVDAKRDGSRAYALLEAGERLDVVWINLVNGEVRYLSSYSAASITIDHLALAPNEYSLIFSERNKLDNRFYGWQVFLGPYSSPTIIEPSGSVKSQIIQLDQKVKGVPCFTLASQMAICPP
jgi:hypothetical protein